MAIRKVAKISESVPTLEGAGVRLRRAFGFNRENLFDPFLLLDDFRGEAPEDFIRGFPDHPHRGIETITYMIEGTVEHGDSLGNQGTIGPGDVQWMTAGSGIIHREMPQPNRYGRMGGFQLWANLPASHKMMNPRYRDVLEAQIPTVELNRGACARVVSGLINGVAGPVQDVVVEPRYLDMHMQPGSVFDLPVPEGHTAFAYVYEGAVLFEGEDYPAGNHSLVLFMDGDRLAGHSEGGARFLLISGRPIREPVAWYGPIVMNTQQELETAFNDLRAGTFIRISR